MADDSINSSDSEYLFNDLVGDILNDKITDILESGSFEETNGDVIIEMDDIIPPTLAFDDSEDGEGGGPGGHGPGEGSGGKLRFSFSFEKFMEIMAETLTLPNLIKEGDGKIKEISHKWKTFGQSGVVMDKRRTFKRAIKGSIATGVFNPDEDKHEILIRRKDKRFHVPKRIETPKHRAVCFYAGDISWSTHGERLKIEKRLVNFIYNWLNYNYGKDNVDHRFFVHEWDSYEVAADEFFNVSTNGGTKAFPVFDQINNVALNEYNPATTNYYLFYFGDGEVFGNDAVDVLRIIRGKMISTFNRIGIVEVIPSSYSGLIKTISSSIGDNEKLKLTSINKPERIIQVIKKLFA